MDTKPQNRKHKDPQNILLERQEHISFKEKDFIFIKNTETQLRKIFRHSTASNKVPYTTAKKSSSSEAKILNAKLQVSVLDDKIGKEIEQLKQLRERILCMEKENKSQPRQQRQNLLANQTSSEKVASSDQINKQTPPSETTNPIPNFMTLGIKLLSTKPQERKSNSDAVESIINNTPRLSAGCYNGGNNGGYASVYQSCYRPPTPTRQHTCCYPAQNYCPQRQQTQGRMNCSCFNSPPRVTPHQGNVYPSFDLQQRRACPQQLQTPNIVFRCTERPNCSRRATDLNTAAFCDYWSLDKRRARRSALLEADGYRRDARDKDDIHRHHRSKSPRHASKSTLNRRMHGKLKQDGVSDISSLEKYKVQSHEKTLKVKLVKQDQGRVKDLAGLKKDKSETAKLHRQYMDRYKTENERTAQRIEKTSSSGLGSRPTYTKLRDSTGKYQDQQMKKTAQQRTIAEKPVRNNEKERDSQRDSSVRRQEQQGKDTVQQQKIVKKPVTDNEKGRDSLARKQEQQVQQQKIAGKPVTANERGRNMQADSSGKERDQQAQQQKIAGKPVTVNEKGRDSQVDSSGKKQDHLGKDTAQQQKIGEKPGTAIERKRDPQIDTTGKRQDQPAKETAQQQKIGEKPVTANEKERGPRTDSSEKNQDQQKTETAQQQKIGEKPGTANERKRDPQIDTTGKRQDQPAKETAQQQKIGERPVTANEKERGPRTDSSEKNQDQQKTETAQQQKIGEKPGTANEKRRDLQIDSSGGKQDQPAKETAQQEKIGEKPGTANEKERGPRTDSAGKKHDQQETETAQQQNIGEKPGTAIEKNRDPQIDASGKRQDQPAKETAQQLKIGEEQESGYEKERRQTKEGAQQQKSGEKGPEQEMKEAPQKKQVREDQVRAYEKGRNLQPDLTEKREDRQATEAARRASDARLDTEPWDKYQRQQEIYRGSISSAKETGFSNDQRQQQEMNAGRRQPDSGKSYNRYGTSSVPNECMCNSSYLEQDGNKNSQLCVEQQHSGQKSFYSIHKLPRQQDLYSDLQRKNVAEDEYSADQTFQNSCQCVQKQILGIYPQASSQGSVPIKQTQYTKRVVNSNCSCADNNVSSKTRIQKDPTDGMSMDCQYRRQGHSKPTSASSCNTYQYVERNLDPRVCERPSSSRSYNQRAAVDQPSAPYCQSQPAYTDPCICERPSSPLSYNQRAALDQPIAPYYSSQQAYTDPRICEGPPSSRSYNQRADVDQPSAPYYQSQPTYSEPRICERPSSSRSYTQRAAVDQPYTPYQSQPVHSEPRICERPSSSRTYTLNAAIDQPYTLYQSQPVYNDLRSCESPSSSHTCMPYYQSQLAYTDPCIGEMFSITFEDEGDVSSNTDFKSCDEQMCGQNNFYDRADYPHSYRSSSSLNTDLTCREREDGCDTCDDSRRLRVPTFDGCPCMFQTYLTLATMCTSKNKSDEE